MKTSITRNSSTARRRLIVATCAAMLGPFAMSTALAAALSGQVFGGGAPIANSTVSLWAATAGTPTQLGQARTGADGHFTISTKAAPAKDASLYLLAKGGRSAAAKSGGDNPAIALLSVVGSKPPSRVTINEMTTVASVWTHAQFLDGTTLKGHALGLKIAAGNVPNFVDIATGGWGAPSRTP